MSRQRLTYVDLPDRLVRDLPFYLAMEEYVARQMDGDAIFFWQVNPTVIFGRHQDIESEVNTVYCTEKGIRFFRRKSGGGCVYADMDNVMSSFVTTGLDIPSTFSSYTAMMADMLNTFGIPAEANGRNDIVVGGRKVSGCAFYRMPEGRCIAHGTMLVDTDLANMSMAITPSSAKMKANGVSSVRSRITTLREEGLQISATDFKEKAKAYFIGKGAEVKTLEANDIEAIMQIAEPYYSHDWIYGRHEKTSMRISRHIDGVGELIVSVSLVKKDGEPDTIAAIILDGDFFTLDDASRISDRLKGVAFTREAVSEALGGMPIGEIIHNLTKENLLSTLFQ